MRSTIVSTLNSGSGGSRSSLWQIKLLCCVVVRFGWYTLLRPTERQSLHTGVWTGQGELL